MKNALVTGSAKRIGAQIIRTIHDDFNVIINYHRSEKEAKDLCDELNEKRKDSAKIISANLSDTKDIEKIIAKVKNLDVLINNASIYYKNPLESTTLEDWENIININTRAPYLLSKGFSKILKKNNGCIINIVDVYADKPLIEYPIYSISKSAIKGLTKALAQELAPEIRVSGVSPGSIFCKGDKNNEEKQKMIQERIPLKKQGSVHDIANAVLFLIKSPYITGHVINVDGGRSVYQ